MGVCGECVGRGRLSEMELFQTNEMWYRCKPLCKQINVSIYNKTICTTLPQTYEMGSIAFVHNVNNVVVVEVFCIVFYMVKLILLCIYAVIM